MSAIFGIFIFFAVIIVTAVIFGAWVIFSLVRLTFHGIGWLLDVQPRGQVVARASENMRCRNPQCHGTNPLTARFCRCCGTPLPQVQRVEARRAEAARRAAVW